MITLDRIIAFALRDRRVLDLLGEALQNDLVVPNTNQRQIVEFASTFALERRKLPGTGDWALWLSSLPDERRDRIRDVLGRLMTEEGFDEYDPDYFGTQVLEELRLVAARTARSRMNAMDRLDPETLSHLAEEVSKVEAATLSEMASIRDVDIWTRAVERDTVIKTGIPTLDRFIGGWGHELWLVLANTGVGKSMLLQNFATYAAQKDNNVLLITLEVNIRPLMGRIYRRISQSHRVEFRTDLDAVKQKINHWLRFTQGNVYVIERPAYSLDPEELTRLIDRVDRLHGVDMVVLDYLDLMTLPKGTRSWGGYEDLGRLTHMVRSNCPQFEIPIISATQSVRRPDDEDRLTVKDMGDSYKKVRGVDGLLTLMQSQTEWEVYQGRIGIAKSRDTGSRNDEITLYINRDLALFADLDHPNTHLLMEQLGHLPHQLAKNPQRSSERRRLNQKGSGPKSYGATTT